MLRAEDGGEVEVGGRGEPVHDMAELVVDGGRVGQDADLEALQARGA